MPISIGGRVTAALTSVIGVVIFCIGLGVVTLNLKEEFDSKRAADLNTSTIEVLKRVDALGDEICLKLGTLTQIERMLEQHEESVTTEEVDKE